VKQVAVAHGLPVLQPERLRDAAVEDAFGELGAELGVVAAYGKLLPEAMLAIPRLGMINVHASLLPKYRGAAPVHRAIMAGETETGVTIMRVIRELDAGPMFAKATRPIGPDETSDVVERNLAEIGARLLVAVVDQLAGGTAREEPQDSATATYAPRLTREEGLIDWSLPASDIHNRVRGLYPWPHAFSYLGAARVIVLRTTVGGRVSGVPGTVVEVARDALHVAAGDGLAVIVHELQPEGRRPMSARDFLAGRPVSAGATFRVR
jgi:methionyl-tRNA formyltransferase